MLLSSVALSLAGACGRFWPGKAEELEVLEDEPQAIARIIGWTGGAEVDRKLTPNADGTFALTFGDLHFPSVRLINRDVELSPERGWRVTFRGIADDPG